MDNVHSLEGCLSTSRPVAALAAEYQDAEHISPHRHLRAQLIHAVSGVMTVTSVDGSWVVPAGRAVWMPANVEHQIRMAGGVAMRTLFIRSDARPGLPLRCEVIEVSPLLREAIVSATRISLEYRLGGRDERVMELILDEIEAAARVDLHVPMPGDPRLARLCEALIARPGSDVTLESLAAEVHISARTLARHFRREVGMTFGEWLRRMRLLLSLPRLSAGVSVTEVALEHGYESPSAFTAMFKRTLGWAPTAYLQEERAPAASTPEANPSLAPRPTGRRRRKKS